MRYIKKSSIALSLNNNDSASVNEALNHARLVAGFQDFFNKQHLAVIVRSIDNGVLVMDCNASCLNSMKQKQSKIMIEFYRMTTKYKIGELDINCGGKHERLRCRNDDFREMQAEQVVTKLLNILRVLGDNTQGGIFTRYITDLTEKSIDQFIALFKIKSSFLNKVEEKFKDFGIKFYNLKFEKQKRKSGKIGLYVSHNTSFEFST